MLKRNEYIEKLKKQLDEMNAKISTLNDSLQKSYLRKMIFYTRSP